MNLSKPEDIKNHILFFITPERITTSTLYELIKISPGKWFDVEELAFRNSVKDISKNVSRIRQIVQEIDEIEYNKQTGQIRLKDLNCIDDVVNECTVLFYSLKINLTEEELCQIIEENNLQQLIVRFVNFGQLKRRDLAPLHPILNDKIEDVSTDVIILKMSSRAETLEIERIINDRYPEIESCLAIKNYFENGCLSINLGTETVSPSHSVSTQYPKFFPIKDSLTDSSVIVANYIYRTNECSIILDKLIQKNLKPQIFRNFIEYRITRGDLQILRKLFTIPKWHLGCFSIITYNDTKDTEKAIDLIKSTFPYLLVSTIHELRNNKEIEVPLAQLTI